MSEMHIRKLEPKEFLETITPLLSYAFRPTPPLDPASEFAVLINENLESGMLIAYEGTKAMASVCTHFMQQNLRGTLMASGGIWGVTAHPEVRRRGYVRALMRASYKDLYESEIAISALYPFRQSFYERLGYVTYPPTLAVKFNTAGLAAISKHAMRGQVRLVNPEDVLKEFYPYLKRKVAEIHGMALMPASTYQSVYDQYPEWIALAYDEAGAVIGCMIYKLVSQGGTFTAKRLLYDNLNARALLLDWIARHQDQTRETSISLIPPWDVPEHWLTDLRPEPERGTAPMVRVIHLEKLNGINSGSGSFSAAFSAAVRDEDCPWNNGTFRFEGEGGHLKISRVNAAPECSLDIRAVTALIFGLRDPAHFPAYGWGEASTETLQIMRDMFPLTLPYLNERF